MTRTPRLRNHLHNIPQNVHSLTERLRSARPASISRKNVVYAGAGIALAGVTGATAAAAFPGQAASAASAQAVTRAAHAAPAPKHTDAAKQAPADHNAAPAKKAPAKKASAKHNPAAHHAETWAAVKRIVASRTFPKPDHGQLPARDQLIPVARSGPQTYLPMTGARWDNAKTIVRQAIDQHMGLRSAVIAVATSMQESGLLNLNYGDRDSLGLFQQRPSCGWGSAAQIQHPAYAAKAFLHALHGYQSSNPAWAHQPLWQSAQGVQASGFPSAYAKWEAQAAHLVASVAKQLV